MIKPRLFLLLLAALTLSAGMPSWWTALQTSPSMESPFIQLSESAVFGKLRRTGRLVMMPGGKLRVAYDTGLLVISDGKVLIQYDPATRTAQRASLQACQQEMPLLGVLLKSSSLDAVYQVVLQPEGRLELTPRQPGSPKLQLEGRAGQLWKLHWLDATGAAQTLELTQPKKPSPKAASTFHFQPPPGTRWVGER